MRNPPSHHTTIEVDPERITDALEELLSPTLKQLSDLLNQLPNQDNALMTKADVATYLNVSIRTIDTLISEGELIPVHVRSARRFTRDSVDRYINRLPSKR
ncbi:MAG: helix-turn-helix domain-containing protein [Chloroflexi bacterium]|nr:helix-turn-helix domain-containing protein [Chloroflexota bacterium]